MTTYSVFLPGDAVADEAGLNRAVFVKEGFSLPAFVFGGFWLLSKRMWLLGPLLIIVAVTIATSPFWLGFPRPAGLAINLLIAGLVGLEAAHLHRRSLERRGFHEAGVVTGRNLQECEQRFFADALGEDEPTFAPSARAVTTAAARPMVPGGILGLFPNAGGRG